MFCPRCRGEYRSGFTRCTACDLDLVEVLPPEPGDEEREAVGSPTWLCDAHGAFEATQVAAELEKRGILYLARQWSGAFPMPDITSVHYYVNESDLARAQAALDELDRSEVAAAGLVEESSEEWGDSLEPLHLERRFRIARLFVYLYAIVNLISGVVLFAANPVVGAYYLLAGVALAVLARLSVAKPVDVFGALLLLLFIIPFIGFVLSRALWVLLPGLATLVAVYFAWKVAQEEPGGPGTDAGEKPSA